MKKFYYITLIAMTAITCIQIGYTNNLYNNYKKKEIIMNYNKKIEYG